MGLLRLDFWRACLVLLMGLLLLVPVVEAGPENPTATEVVAAIKSTYASVSSVRADFTQVRRDAALQTEDRQKGKVTLKRPRKMRFDFTSPATKTFVTDGTTLWIYDPAQNQVIQQPDLGTDSGLGVLLDDLSKLDEIFSITMLPDDAKANHTLQLVPRQSSGAFKSLQLSFSKQKYVLQDVVLVDAMNNVTEMHFTSVKFNQEVSDSEFVFVAPPGVQVIKAGG